MGNETENDNAKTQVSMRLDSTVLTVVSKLAIDEGRPSLTNMVERLLRTHPQVQPILEGNTAEIAA